jgi:hypothetical protein
LKFHNPDVAMDVKQTQLKGGPATLTVEFGTVRTREGLCGRVLIRRIDSADKKPVVIDCQHKHEKDIIKQLINITKATQLPINERDEAAVTEWLEDKKRREVFEAEKMARRAAAREAEKNQLGAGSA